MQQMCEFCSKTTSRARPREIVNLALSRLWVNGARWPTPLVGRAYKSHLVPSKNMFCLSAKPCKTRGH